MFGKSLVFANFRSTFAAKNLGFRPSLPFVGIECADDFRKLLLLWRAFGAASALCQERPASVGHYAGDLTPEWPTST
jgi:hypothetical protein